MPSRSDSRRRLLLLLLFVLAVLLRGLYLFDLKDYEFADRLDLDQAAYARKAEAILDGESPAPGRPFYQSPLYAYFLAGVYAVAGRSPEAARVVQVLLGGASVLFLALIGEKAFGRAAGIVAGLGAALYAPFPFFEAQIMKTSLGVFLLVAGVLLLLRGRGGRTDLGAGFLLGLAALVRETDLVFLLFGALALLWGRERSEGSVRRALLLLAGGILAIGPVAARNRAVSGEWVLVTSQGGQNFYIGNNERAAGTYTELPFVRPDPRYEEEDFQAEAARRLGREPSPSEVSQYWYGEAFRWMRENPGKAASLLARKALLFWNALELPDNENFYYMRDRFPSLRLLPIGFGMVAMFGLIGMAASLGRFRSLFVLYTGVGATFASLAAFYVFSRYRLPAVPFLLLFAAEGGRITVASILDRRWKRLALLLAGLVASFAVVFAARPIDFDPRTDGYVPLHVNRAMTFAEEGKSDEAIREYREALRLAPEHPSVRKRLVRLLIDAGREEEAILELEETVRLQPGDARARNDLAVLLLRAGRREEALGELREAVRLEPGFESPHRNLARLLAEAGEEPEASRELAIADSLRSLRGTP